MTFKKYIEVFGLERLWDFEHRIPEDMIEEITEEFISRRIGRRDPEIFEVNFRHQIKLKQDKFIRLLETEYIAFDPMAEQYRFEEFESRNIVERSGKQTGSGTATTGNDVTVTHESGENISQQRTDDLEQQFVHGHQVTVSNRSNTETTVEGENNSNGKSRDISSDLPESNVSAVTGTDLGEIDWRYASNATDRADTRKDETNGTTNSSVTQNLQTLNTGTDTTYNTGTQRTQTNGERTGRDITTGGGTNESTNRTEDDTKTDGRNSHTLQQSGRNRLPQEAIQKYREFIRASTAREWLLRELDPVFYGLF